MPPSPVPAQSWLRRRWWIVAIALVAVAGLASGITWFVVRDSGTKTELYAEAMTSTGPDPFTPSTAIGSAAVITTRLPTVVPSTSAGAVTKVTGSTEALYGGTTSNSSCDREKQIAFLTANTAEAAAFAGVLNIRVGQIPEYLRSLTPVLLTVDTRVTNHGYVDGHATARQSVLQAGSAVLVDGHGVPRVRCYCGNPLTDPQPLAGDVTTFGGTWNGYDPDRFVAVAAAEKAITSFVLVDVVTGEQFIRPAGSTGDRDSPVGGKCAAQPDDAMHDLLVSRRSGDRAAAAGCASTRVVDYLFGLSDEFASALTTAACRPPSELGLDSDADAACKLSNNAIVLLDKKRSGEFYAAGIVLVEQPPSSTPSASATPQACGTGAPAFHPTTRAEIVLVRFFAALNDQQYSTAYGLLSDELKQNWMSIGPTGNGLTNFSAFYRAHLRCVTVTSIKVTHMDDPTVSASLGIQWYEVQFDDEYISPFPAGSGELQPFYRVHADPHEGPGRPPDRITGEATGH